MKKLIGQVLRLIQLLERASAESTKALASAPDDERVKRLVAAVKKARG